MAQAPQQDPDGGGCTDSRGFNGHRWPWPPWSGPYPGRDPATARCLDCGITWTHRFNQQCERTLVVPAEAPGGTGREVAACAR